MIASTKPNWDLEFSQRNIERFSAAVDECCANVPRGIRQFAEEEIVPTTGPRANLPFDINTQPFARLLWEEFENPYWYEYAITGCTQTGKSFLGFDVPVVHRVCELQEDAIIAAPIMETLKDKIKRDIKPLILNSRYAHLWPTSGAAGRGGVPDLIELGNGASIKLMSFEGGPTNKASFTCPNVYITEIDGKRVMTSVEAKAMSLIVARARAESRANRFILYECTTTSKRGPIWKLVNLQGSASQIMRPCPHCKKFSRPDRPHLKGWQDATSEIQAEKRTAWHCPRCDKPWTEEQRYEANLQSKLMHKGQTIDDAGNIHGPMPETRTLGFRFSAIDSMFLKAEDIGVDCYQAAQDDDEIDAEKKLTQQVFALPFEEPGFERVEIDRDLVEQRRLQYPKGCIPNETAWISIGVDVGKYRCHWVAIAWLVSGDQRRGLIFDYGTVELKLKINGEELSAKELGFDQVFSVQMNEWKRSIDAGWKAEDGELKSYDALWIDTRWQGDEDDDVVYNWLKEHSDKRLKALMGHSKNSGKKDPYRKPRPSKNGKTDIIYPIGHYYHIVYMRKEGLRRVHVDADAWKLIVQHRVTTQADKPGALMLYDDKNPKEHATIVKHWDAETREESFESGKGKKTTWNVQHRANHYLDATAYGCAAGHYLGFRVIDKKKQVRKPPVPAAPITAPGGRAFLASQR